MARPLRRHPAAAAFGWVLAAAAPLAFVAVFFAYPVLTVVGDGLRGLGDVLGRSAIREGAVVHGLAGDGLHGSHAWLSAFLRRRRWRA